MILMIVMVLTKLHIDRIPEGIVEKWVKDIHLPQRTTQKKKKNPEGTSRDSSNTKIKKENIWNYSSC